MTDRLNKLLSDSVHEGTPPLWAVEREWDYEEANNRDAERAEQEFPERFVRADLSFEWTDGTPSLWSRLWNWFCGTETRSES